MTIGRRQAVGLGAMGLGAVALDGCGALPWGKAATPQPAEVERLLGELDHVLLRLKSLEPPVEKFGIKPGEPYVAQGQAVCTRLLTTLCIMGTLRDVPQAMWSEARIEERLIDALPDIQNTITTALQHLASIDDEESARIDKRLHDDPNLPMRIIEHIDDHAKKVHVPIELRTYLRTATTQLSWRMRYEGAKEVTTGLAAKYKRAVASRSSLLGMQADEDAGAGGGQSEEKPQEKRQPTPIRVRFRTRAASQEVRTATCALEPKVTLGGAERQVVLDWEEFRCPTAPAKVPDAPLVRGAVHLEPLNGGENVVTVVLYPTSDDDTDALTASVTTIAEDLRRKLSERQQFIGQACATSADCGPLRCVEERCRDPYGLVTTSPVVASRLGSAGESCRTRADCETTLLCEHATCKIEEEVSSAKLMKTTRVIAKYGAYLSIPPICAIGALVLLTCLFMVIIAGCMYAGGD